MYPSMIRATDKIDFIDVTKPSNIVTGSTIIFFDESDEIDNSKDMLPDATDSGHLEMADKEDHFVSTTASSSIESEVPTNQPPLKGDKDDSEGTTVNNGKNPVKDILNLGSLGINGLNALGPVINAMADLFQTKFNSGRKNTTKFPPTFKPISDDIPRPVYIPTLDSEVAESQNLDGQNIFIDTMQRTRQTERPNIEAALLSGGIPISPGQVITTNSDVIIGKPAVHGPRPPINKSFQKEVEGMKPPPLPNKGSWQLRDPERYSAHLPQRNTPLDNFPPRREQFPSKVQTSVNYKQQNKINFIDLRHEGTAIKFPSGQLHLKPHESVLHSSKPIDIFQNPVSTGNKVSLESHRNRRPTIKERPHHPTIYPDDTADLRPPAIQTLMPPNEDFFKEHSIYLSNKDVKYNQNTKQPNEIKVDTSSLVREHGPPNLPVAEPTFAEQLFVDIQPSQVANVIIPHGAPTALIYNQQPEILSQKGEIINDPSPYPDAEVGIVGVSGLIQQEDDVFHAAILPSNAVRMDVPVSPQGIGVESFPIIHKEEKKKSGNYNKKIAHKPELPFDLETGLDYMAPPPPPPIVAEDINYHIGGKGELEDQEGEYSFKNEYQAEDEGPDDEFGEDVNIKHGLFFNRTQNKQETVFGGIKVLPPPQHFSNYSGTSDGVSFSVMNSKPVILGSDSTESQPPIIKGKPGVSSFVNNSEATVSVGQMTNLKPNDELDIPSNPFYNIHLSTIIRKPQVFEKQNRTNSKPFDNTVYTMNIDEKPPVRTFVAPQNIPFNLPRPLEMDSLRLTPRPIFDRNSEVAGLTPPAIARPHETITHRPSWRPPTRKRPPPPYKFELPVTSADRLKKPSLLETERPPPPPVPTEVLSPPKQVDIDYFTHQKKTITTEKNNFFKYTTSNPESINPILGGTLKVEEIAKKPEVITADSKVMTSNSMISDNLRNKIDSQLVESKLSPTYVKPNVLTAAYSNELIIASETVPDDDIPQSSTQGLKGVTRPTLLVSSGSTTVFKDNYKKSSVTHIKPTRVVQSHRTIIPFHIQTNDSITEEIPSKINENHVNISDGEIKLTNIPQEHTAITPTPTIYVMTHTHTLTVTTTESRIIQSKGQKPSTHTLIVTKTLMSTVLDTVTEVHTVLKPTSILSTVTTTIPQATTTVYPTFSTQQPKTESKLEKNENQLNEVQDTLKHLPNQNYAKEHKYGNHQHVPNLNDNDSILVVMTDQNTDHKLSNFGSNLEPAPEIEEPITEVNEVAPNVLLSGFLSQFNSQSECKPECKATRNERCQKINNVMRCTCRPGFARMFPDQPCKREYFLYLQCFFI